MNKQSRKLPDIISFYFIGVSLFGLCLLAMLIFNMRIPMITFPLQKQLTGSIFCTICLLGAVAGIYPSRCSRMYHFKTSSYRTKQTGTEETRIRLKGHHPVCGNFSAHILKLGSKTCCAGCTGLIAGAVISLLGSFLYFFDGFHTGEASTFVFWLGFVGVACGLLQYHLLNLNRGTVHFFLNVIFVFGAFLLLVGIDGITGNFVLELYLLTLIVYWILARIMLSQLEHKKICATCSLKSCSFT